MNSSRRTWCSLARGMGVALWWFVVVWWAPVVSCRGVAGGGGASAFFIPFGALDDESAFVGVAAKRVDGFVRVSLDRKALREATVGYMATIGLDGGSRQCLRRNGVAWRMAPIDAFVAGCSRAGPCSVTGCVVLTRTRV